MTGPARVRGDEGFSLVETIVALGIVGAVMTSAVIFFVGSGGVLRRQADTQAAVQLAAGAMDYASQLPGKNLLVGRTEAAVDTQKAEAIADGWRAPEVAAYLDTNRTKKEFQDPSLSTTSSLKPLPTLGEEIKIDGASTPFERWWFVGSCRQPATGGECKKLDTGTPAYNDSVEMFRIVVAVTWPSPECPNRRCEYAVTMLTEADLADPVWKQ